MINLLLFELGHTNSAGVAMALLLALAGLAAGAAGAAGLELGGSRRIGMGLFATSNFRAGGPAWTEGLNLLQHSVLILILRVYWMRCQRHEWISHSHNPTTIMVLAVWNGKHPQVFLHEQPNQNNKLISFNAAFRLKKLGNSSEHKTVFASALFHFSFQATGRFDSSIVIVKSLNFNTSDLLPFQSSKDQQAKQWCYSVGASHCLLDNHPDSNPMKEWVSHSWLPQWMG